MRDAARDEALRRRQARLARHQQRSGTAPVPPSDAAGGGSLWRGLVAAVRGEDECSGVHVEDLPSFPALRRLHGLSVVADWRTLWAAARLPPPAHAQSSEATAAAGGGSGVGAAAGAGAAAAADAGNAGTCAVRTASGMAGLARLQGSWTLRLHHLEQPDAAAAAAAPGAAHAGGEVDEEFGDVLMQMLGEEGEEGGEDGVQLGPLHTGHWAAWSARAARFDVSGAIPGRRLRSRLQYTQLQEAVLQACVDLEELEMAYESSEWPDEMLPHMPESLLTRQRLAWLCSTLGSLLPHLPPTVHTLRVSGTFLLRPARAGQRTDKVQLRRLLTEVPASVRCIDLSRLLLQGAGGEVAALWQAAARDARVRRRTA